MFPSPPKLVVSPSISLRTHDCNMTITGHVKKIENSDNLSEKPFGGTIVEKHIFNFKSLPWYVLNKRL